MLLARSGATAGKALIVPNGIGTACHAGYLIKARVDRSITDPRYFFYFTQSSAFSGWRNLEFIQSTIPNINADKYSNLSLPLPRLDEQRLIVRFLDWHGAQAAKLIRAKKKIIALLSEQKQAIIHRAVSRGLNPNVRLKPSGIPWLGDAPESWEVQRLGRLIELTAGYAFKSSGFTDADNDIRLLRGINVSPGKVRWQSVVRWPIEDGRLYADFALRVGDIVIGMDRPIIQAGIRIARVSEEDVPSLLLQRVARVKFLAGVHEQFGFLVLGGKSFIDYLTPIFSGISVPHISPQQISDFRIALPSVDEQREIVDAVNAQTRTISLALSGIEREIAAIQEFRTRLIADVVTGKLDVRAAAAKLPETAELEAIDALGEVDDLDEMIDDAESEEVAA